MNNDTSKTSRTAPMSAKPDLVKRIGNTTFDIQAKQAGKPLRTR